MLKQDRSLRWKVMGFGIVFSALLGCAQGFPAGEKPSESDKVLAVIDGTPVTETDLVEAAGSALQDLELKRDEFEAKQEQERYETLRVSLDRLISERLIELEAKARGISVAALIEEEIDSKVDEPTEDEIERIYQINRARLRRPVEQVRGDIVRFLVQEKQRAGREEFVDSLKSKYNVEDRMEPHRFEIETVGHPNKGPRDAPVTLVEFSDFECPYCTQMSQTLKQVQTRYGESVRRVFRQFPLNSIHPNAQKAAEASLCANDQNRFWEMFDRLFESPRRLELSALRQKASEIGLDTEEFDGCLGSGRHSDQVRKDLRAGVLAGVSGTPAVFVNGRPVSGNASLQTISQLIDEELSRR